MRKTFLPTAVRAVSSVLVLSALAFSSAYAAGLGKLTVLSSLGQPLRAEIELNAVSKDDGGAIAAKLAPMEAFRKANINFNPALSSLRFSVEKRGERQIIRITSAQPMNEPFVDMLLELNSSSGQLVREYTFLLDPAELRSAAAQVVAPVAVPALGVEAVQSRAARVTREAPPVRPAVPAPLESEKPAKVAKEKVAKEKPARPAEEMKEAKGAAQHRVKKGDTLAVIAKDSKPEDISLEQMLVAIYRANPDAFAGENMNRLKVGKVLSIPEADVAGSVSKAEARKVIVAQSADFTSYRNRLAGAAAQATPQKAAEGGQVSGGKVGAKVEERPTAATEAQDKLKVARADAAKGDKASGTASTEDKLAKDKAAAEAQARIKDLEKNISDLQGVMQLKNKDLAAQQQKAEMQAGAKPAAASTPAASASVVASAPAAEASTPASVPAASVPKKKVVPPPPPPPEEPGFFDDLLENPLVLAGTGLIVLLLGYVFVRRRKNQPAQQPEDDIHEESKDAPNSLFGTTGGQSVDTNNSIFNSSFTPSASLLDTNEVDPIAEADVYIAYGREAQAIEILKEALRNHPERHALRIKLLEIYASKKDLHAFDLLASELYSLTKGEGEEWVYAAGLGVSIDPGNPLYAGGDLSEELLSRPTSLHSSVTRPSEDLDPDIRLATSRTPEIVEQGVHVGLQIPQDQLLHPDLPLDLASAELGSAPDESPGFDMPVTQEAVPAAHAVADLHGETGSVAEEAPHAAAATLNFDLGDTDAFMKPDASHLVATDKAEVDGGLDFVMATPAVEPAPVHIEHESEVKQEPEQKAGALDSLDFDLGDMNFGKVSLAAEAAPASVSGMSVTELADDALDHLIEFNPSHESGPEEVTPAAIARQAGVAHEELHVSGAEESQNMPEISPEVQPQAPFGSEPVAPAFDFGGINLDLDPTAHVAAQTEVPASPPAPASGSLEMETKLDLADAYLGIGDKEGARELLDEVILEGSGVQVERAKATLAKIS